MSRGVLRFLVRPQLLKSKSPWILVRQVHCNVGVFGRGAAGTARDGVNLVHAGHQLDIRIVMSLRHVNSRRNRVRPTYRLKPREDQSCLQFR